MARLNIFSFSKLLGAINDTIKKWYLKCILALGFILVLAGCATNDWYAAMNKDWDEAQAIDTIDGYLNFLNKHPYSPQAKLARKSYFKLLEEQEGVPITLEY